MNIYEERDGYMVGYTKKGYEFYFDTEDYELINKYDWAIKSNGNVIAYKYDNKHQISMHILIMGKGRYHHKNQCNYDNRKSNLIRVSVPYNNNEHERNKYIRIKVPNHPHSDPYGWIGEHIIVAEEKLGRLLKHGECVHHIDGNPKNNSPDNLIVFSSIGDHTLFHHGSDIVLNEDGTYSAIRKENIPLKYNNKNNSSVVSTTQTCFNNSLNLYVCPVCGKKMNRKSHICVDCYNKKKSEHIPEKSVLLNDILSMSIVKVGKKYGVSDNAIRKWCKKYDLPYKYDDIKKLRQNI